MKNKLIVPMLILLFFSSCDKIQSSSKKYFFPKEVESIIDELESFDIGSWNYVIVPDQNKARKICSELKGLDAFIETAICLPKLQDFSELLESWVDNQFRLFKAPSKEELLSHTNTEISKMSYYMGAEGAAMFRLSRKDPMNYKDVYWKLAKGNSFGSFEWDNELLKLKNDSRVIIPIKLSFPGAEIEKTNELVRKLSKLNSSLIGRHQGFLENKTQIKKDLRTVTLTSIALFLLFILLLTKLKILQALVVVVPAFLSSLIGAGVTILYYGEIHALTIAFGAGIIGLGADYGLHAFFSKNNKTVWRSNLYGMITTLVVFCILLKSSVPLIRQMMFFSSVGILCSFIMTKIFLSNFKIEHKLKLDFKMSKIHLLGLVIAFGGSALIFMTKFDLNMYRFNYASAKSKSNQKWLYTNLGKKKVFYKIYSNIKNSSYDDFKSLESSNITYEGKFKYFPHQDAQKENIDSWKELSKMDLLLPSKTQKIFAPFLSNLKMISKQETDFSKVPKFTEHLMNGKNSIGLWFSDNSETDKVIRKKISGVRTLIDIMDDFSYFVVKDLFVLAISSFLIILGILFFRYRDLYKVMTALVPFVFSLGTFFSGQFIFGYGISFMSIVGLFLIYGLSVDYGIFSTDLNFLSDSEVEKEEGVNIGLLLSWVSSFIGFFPLALCDHNILKDLGIVIIIGLLGVFYSTFYIVPSLANWRKRNV